MRFDVLIQGSNAWRTAPDYQRIPSIVNDPRPRRSLVERIRKAWRALVD